jgi:hypothetical protein
MLPPPELVPPLLPLEVNPAVAVPAPPPEADDTPPPPTPPLVWRQLSQLPGVGPETPVPVEVG